MESHSRLLGLRPRLPNLNMRKALHLEKSNMGHFSLCSPQSKPLFRSSKFPVAVNTPALLAVARVYQDLEKAKRFSLPYVLILFFAVLGRCLALIPQLKIVATASNIVVIATGVMVLLKYFRSPRSPDVFTVYKVENGVLFAVTAIPFRELVSYAPKESGILFPRPFGTPFLKEGHLKSCLIAIIGSLKHSAPSEFEVGYVDTEQNPLPFREDSPDVIESGIYPYIRAYRKVWFRRISEGGFQK